MMSLIETEFLLSLTRYAKTTKCACTTCRCLRERYIEMLEQKIVTTQKELRNAKNPLKQKLPGS